MVSKVKTKKSAAPVRQRKGRTSTSRISSQHQVTVPVDILRASGIREGDEVVFVINSAGAIEIRKEIAAVERALAKSLADLAACADGFPNGFNWEKERAAAWRE